MPGEGVALVVNLSVVVPEPGAARLAGVNEAETPAGSWLMEKEIAELNPPLAVVVTVSDPLLEGRMDRLVTEGVTVSAGSETESLQ